jgi:hypothetical protein
VLQNLAALDVGLECRWAVELQDGGYQRLTTSDDEYSLFAQVVHDIKYQLADRQYAMGTLLNYSEKLVIQTSNNNCSAGLNILSIQGPGTGEAWIIESFTVINVNTVCSYILTGVGIGSIVAWIDQVSNQPAGIQHPVSGRWSLSNDAVFQANFYGCQAGDDIYLAISGYKMDLAG